MEDEIRALMADRLLDRPAREALAQVSDTDLLLEAGVLTSLKVVQLVALLEARFGVTFGALDIDLENLGTISGIARLIARIRADG